MSKLLARVRVVLTAAPTYLVLAAAILTAAAAEFAELGAAIGYPEVVEQVVAWCVRVAAILGSIVLIIRRVTPVPELERGLLPPPPPPPLPPPGSGTSGNGRYVTITNIEEG